MISRNPFFLRTWWVDTRWPSKPLYQFSAGLEGGNKVGKILMGQEKGSLIKQKQRLSAEAKENKRFVVYIPAGNTQTLPGKEGFTMHSGCSASSTDNSCHPSVTEEIQIQFCAPAAWWHQSTLYTSAYQGFLLVWVWCARQSNPHGPVSLTIPFLLLVTQKQAECGIQPMPGALLPSNREGED